MKNIQRHESISEVIENVIYNVEIVGEGQPLFYLHGFGEDHTTWDNLDILGYRSYKIDLLGHGESSKNEEKTDYCLDVVIQQLHILIQRLTKTKYSILGYSLGGRIALAYAVRYPEKIKCLILESSGIGIRHNTERLTRLKSDKELADQIIKHGISWFETYWSNLEIFTSQKRLPKSVQTKIKERRLNNTPKALANMLVECSQGVFPYYGDKIANLKMPILYLSGEFDKKYSKIGKDLLEIKPDIVYIKAKNSGHNVHLEQPEFFCQSITQFLKNQKNS